MEQSRAQAQIDLILSIGERIEQLRTAGMPVLTDTIAHHFIELLERLSARSGVRSFLPKDTNNVLQGARGMIGKESDKEGE